MTLIAIHSMINKQRTAVIEWAKPGKYKQKEIEIAIKKKMFHDNVFALQNGAGDQAHQQRLD